MAESGSSVRANHETARERHRRGMPVPARGATSLPVSVAGPVAADPAVERQSARLFCHGNRRGVSPHLAAPYVPGRRDFGAADGRPPLVAEALPAPIPTIP